MAGDNAPTGPGDDYPGDSSGHLNPALQQFVGAQDTPMGKAWAGVAADRVQTYLTARSNALDAENSAQAFQNNMTSTRDGLVNLVKSDPGATDLALDLAQHSVNGVTDQHGHLDPDARSGAANDLIQHFQSEIAHAAVQSLAEKDKDAALQALDRYGKYIPDDQQGGLRLYAQVQDELRAQDGNAQQLQAMRDKAAAGYNSATSYINAMRDPTTGEFRSPPNYLQQLVADPSLATPTRLALHSAFNMLTRNAGEVQSSAPVVHDFIQRIADPNTPTPQQGEIISHLGSGLSVGDGAFLNHLLGPADPQRRADIRQLADTMQQAQETLAHPANGSAGQAAFQRFTSWLVPALARGLNLNELTQGNYLQRFAPTVRDYKATLAPSAVNDRAVGYGRRNLARGAA